MYSSVHILIHGRYSKNKNDNIHKNEVQNIGLGIPIEFLSQRKKNIEISAETTKVCDN